MMLILKLLAWHPLITYPVAAFAALQLAALALLLKKSKTTALLLSGSSLASIILLSLPITSVAILNSLQDRHPRFKPIKNGNQANAVVALGGGIRPLSDSELNKELGDAGDRLAIAIGLIKSGYAKTLVISGGLPSQSGSKATNHEASLAKSIAIRSGLKEKQIILNKAGHNTGMEAEFIASLASDRKWHRLIISTSAYHMPRTLKKISGLTNAQLIAAPSDFRTVYAATIFTNNELNQFIPTFSALNESTRSIKEYIGIFSESIKQSAIKHFLES